MSARRPRVRQPKPWRFPQAERHELDNGLGLLVYYRPGQYVVSAGLLLDLPLTAEPAPVEGVAGLTVQTLDEGTASHPGTSFADAVEGCGAVLDGVIGYAHTAVTLDVPGAHLPGAARLLAEAVAEPTLSDHDVDRHRRLRVAHIEQALATSSERANHAFRHALLADTSRAQRLAGGELPTLSAVTGEDVRTHHRRWFGPEGSTLVVAGDFVPPAIDALAEAFGGWTNPHQERAVHEVPSAREASCHLVDRPGSVQADIRWGWWTIDRSDARWPAFQLATHALGGAYFSRLNRVLREERGYTYGVTLANSPLRSGGFTTVQGSFRNEVVGAALELMPTLLDVVAEPLSSSEVTRARGYLVGVSPLRYATASGLCDGVLHLLAAGLGPEHVDTQLAAWRRVAPDTATEAARELIHPEAGTLVVVGDAGVLEPQLRASGWNPRVVPVGEWI